MHDGVDEQHFRECTIFASFSTITFVQFGNTIRRRREALGLTLEQLAERANLTPNYIGSVELGKRDPSLSTIEAIAKALRVTAGDMLGAQGLDAVGLEAGRLVQALSPDTQVALLEFLRTLKRRR